MLCNNCKHYRIINFYPNDLQLNHHNNIKVINNSLPPLNNMLIIIIACFLEKPHNLKEIQPLLMVLIFSFSVKTTYRFFAES